MIPALCPVCGASFTPTRGGHTVCGATCRQRKRRGTPAPAPPYVVTSEDRAAIARVRVLVPIPLPALSEEQVRAHVLATAGELE